jgi:2-oxoglutarate dehydrogenase E2 component (dihydrolipoamide succinyltransferase)
MAIVEMRVPTIGESITEVTLSQWLKGNGEFVKLDEPICEFESDKATLEFPAEAEGKLIYVAAEDDDIEIGGLVAKIDTSFAAPTSDETPAKEEAPVAETKTTEVPATPAQSTNYATGHPSPAAGKILRENNVNPADVSGTGKDGRITKEDAQKAAQNKPAPAAAKVSAPEVTAPVVTTAYSRGTREEKMSRMRRTIAGRLVSAKNNTAMLTTFNEVDLSEVMKLRKKVQEKFVEKHGVKLGFMSLFAKACANVLMEMPSVNAMINGNNILYNEFVDISIAISTPTGLVVPPVRNVESMDFHEIEKAIKGLAVKAREGKLTLDEMKGGTFTITNGGVFGSLVSTPIINEPQSAILGMHAIKERPVAINGQVEIRPMMYLALSYDHRLIDGSTSVTFLVKVKEQLEDPMKLLLNI